VPAFAQAVEDDDESGEWVRPPPAERRVEREADQDRAGEVGVDERPSVRSTGFSSALPVWVLAAARASMARQVTPVQAMPRRERCGCCAAISV
jgi:hypothetical protein